MVHPMVESYILRGWWNSMLRGWKKKYKTSIRVESNSSMELMEYKLFNQLGEELIT
jgi:ribonuclease G